MKCARCGFHLEPVDIKANSCPACGQVIDPRRRGENQRQKFRKDERVKRPR